jgi:prepilin-type N-terminal cleavage/methylation domain-containing protein
MTSSLNKAGRARGRRRAGFTLVELLVVMGIILVLITLIFPSLSAVWKGSVRTRMTADLQAIGTALEAYRQDHSDYPRIYAAGTGAHQLCRALIAPAGNDPVKGPLVDGYGAKRTPTDAIGLDPSPGFRTRPGGKVYPPYLPADKFKLVDPASPRNPNPDVYTAVIGDRYSNPILYYPGNKLAAIDKLPSSTPTERGGYAAVGDYTPQSATSTGGIKPMFNANDNVNVNPSGTPIRGMPVAKLQILLGEYTVDNSGGFVPNTSKNGRIDPGENPAFLGPFLLVSAGPDEEYGVKDENRPLSAKNRCDDVTNYPRAEY